MTLLPTLRASAAGCSACRTSILSLFISPHAPVVSTRAQHASSSLARLLPQAVPVKRSRFYTTQKAPNNESQGTAELEVSSKTGADAAGDDRDGDVPWYLQEEPPRHPALVHEPHPLPEIPKGSPAILHHLVQYVAEDMGLDDLNLMDLRTLDPPAALGPSLIMLFGTARTERHLHVSGHNLKSWLRTKGIQAHADGLLGRNEYKIKKRRLMRKAKLLGTSAMPMGGDDGVATRWICMNLGTIGSTEQEESAVESVDGRFTGFGIQQTGTTLVVQILTESKRKELDLETLWSRILKRRGDDNLVEDDMEYVEADVHPNELSLFTEGGSLKVFATPSQRRFFSTCLRRPSTPGSLRLFSQVTDPPKSDFNINDVDKSLDPATFISAKTAELEQLQAGFAGFSYAGRIEALESSETGLFSPFLEQWRRAIEDLPPEQSWRFRLWLCGAGRKIGVRRFDFGHLRELVQEMELFGIICYQSHYLELLQAIYQEPSDSRILLAEQSTLAVDILNIMYERGEPIITTSVIVSLIESLAQGGSQGPETRELQAVLEKFLLQADLPYMGEAALARLLDAYAAQDNWTRFWEIWRMPPKFQEARSEKLYIHLWAIMAESKHQSRCQDAVRWCFHEMLNENPPVKPVGQVKAALEACMRVADPEAEEIAQMLVVRDEKTKETSLYETVHLFRALNTQWMPRRL